MDVSKRAKVLIQAMPYIKKYSGETIVGKIRRKRYDKRRA